MLAAFGVTTVADLYAQRAALRHVFSPISCDFFWHAYLGLGSTMAPEKASDGDVTRKGISCERTFAPISQKAELEAKVAELAEHLAGDMAGEGIAGKCVTLKLKETTFQARMHPSCMITVPTARAGSPRMLIASTQASCLDFTPHMPV